MQDRVPDKFHQRQNDHGIALGPLHSQCIRSPVDVVDLQPTDFAGSKPLLGKELKDGMIPQTKG